MISYETFSRLISRDRDENDALIEQYCRGDRSSLSADELEYMRILAGEIPEPPDPSKILSQFDIDGILFVELPSEMSLQESRKWLSIRMVDYAMDQAKMAGPVYAKSTAAECMYLTERNVNEAISLYRHKQWVKKLGHETPKERAERDGRIRAFIEERRKRSGAKDVKAVQVPPVAPPAPAAVPPPVQKPADEPEQTSAPPAPPRHAAAVVEEHYLPEVGPSVAPGPKEDLSFLC